MRVILLYIATSPTVCAKLQAEIDEAVSSGRVTSNPVLQSEAKELPYLQACILEGLRIFPPITGLLSKQVPKGGDTINGQFIPGGTRIAMCTWGFRGNEVFGKDTELYRPERWIEADSEQLKSMKKVQDLVFGNGRFGCLGKTIALLELDKVIFEVGRLYFRYISPNPVT